MKYVLWTLLVVLAVIAGGFLYWTLPGYDVVRILGTEVARQQVEVTDAQGREVMQSRDVRYIKAVTPDGEPRVYRNQDTGWGWPPYFKFDSANLAALADNAASSEDNPRWMVVTHYGWRLPIFSKFPNALSIEPAASPDGPGFPWFNVAFLVILAALVAAVWLWIRRLIGRWRDRRAAG